MKHYCRLFLPEINADLHNVRFQLRAPLQVNVEETEGKEDEPVIYFVSCPRVSVSGYAETLDEAVRVFCDMFFFQYMELTPRNVRVHPSALSTVRALNRLVTGVIMNQEVSYFLYDIPLNKENHD